LEHSNLRVGTLYSTAWRTPLRHFGAFVQFGLGPLLLAILFCPPSYYVQSGDDSLSLTDGVFTIWDVIGFLVSLPFAAAFAAPWCRLVVTEDVAAMGTPTSPFDRRTWRVAWAFLRLLFVLTSIVLVILAGLFLALGHFHDGRLSFQVDLHGLAAVPAILGSLGATIAIAWFMIRLALIIPAASMGKHLALRESWRMTQAAQFRLLLAGIAVFLAYLATMLLLLIPVSVLTASAGVRAAFFLGLPFVFAGFAFAHALWAGFLGAAYRGLSASIADPAAAIFE